MFASKDVAKMQLDVATYIKYRLASTARYDKVSF